MIYMYAYSNASKTAKALAKAMGIKRLKHTGSKAKPSVVVYWGKGPTYQGPKLLNPLTATMKAVDKKLAFLHMKAAGVSIPPVAHLKEDAEKWLDGRTKVVCRHTVTGHEGKGIEIKDKAPLPYCSLYTKYIPKKKEFRIHVVGDKIIDRQQKVLSSKHQGPTCFEVRNTANGFIFQRQGIHVPQDVDTQALAAIKALGLDFGAVDVIWNEKQDKAYVLEVNTAPGLEGSSIENYAKALKNLIKEKFNVG